jgi:hypothetical protein
MDSPSKEFLGYYQREHELCPVLCACTLGTVGNRTNVEFGGRNVVYGEVGIVRVKNWNIEDRPPTPLAPHPHHERIKAGKNENDPPD